MSGKEKRLRLIKAETVAEQAKYINHADIVIWACGYSTNEIPIFEASKQEKPGAKNCVQLKLSQMKPGTQFDVDNRCRVMLENNIVLNKVFGCGIGYPVRTNDGKTVVSQALDK